MKLIERINYEFNVRQGRKLVNENDQRGTDGYKIIFEVIQEVFDDQQRQIDELKKTLAALGVRT